jgi:hypothetical protein
VRPHVQTLPGEELARPHLVEEDERADHLPLACGQGAADLEAADVVGAGDDDGLHAWLVTHTGSKGLSISTPSPPST